MKEKAIDILKSGTLEEVKKLFPDNKSSLELPLGKNPLHYAAYNPNKEIMLFLLDEIHLQPDRPSENGTTPLHEAATCGNLQVICLLIDRGADYDKKNILGQNIITILKRASKFELVDPVKKIIEKDRSSKEVEKTPDKPTEILLRNRYNSPSPFFSTSASTLSGQSVSSDREALLNKRAIASDREASSNKKNL